MSSNDGNTVPEPIILSGGSELVSIHVAEALWKAGIPYSVISLVPNSLLKEAAGSSSLRELKLSGLSEARAAERLMGLLETGYRDNRDAVVVLPTEDDGLRLLHSGRARGDADFLQFSRARRVVRGGLAKKELFEFLAASGSADLCSPTHVLNAPSEIPALIKRLGSDLIIKPSAKPFGRSIDALGSKAFHVTSSTESQTRAISELKAVWNLAGAWIVQPRLEKFQEGEISVCMVRGSSTHAVQVAELIKYPKHAGTACAVTTLEDRSLIPLADRIAKDIDLVGICELTFLRSATGQPKLIELNTRPWLQVSLMEHIGFQIIALAISCLTGRDVPTRGYGS